MGDTPSGAGTSFIISSRQTSETFGRGGSEFLENRNESLLPGELRVPAGIKRPTPVDWARLDSQVNLAPGTPLDMHMPPGTTTIVTNPNSLSGAAAQATRANNNNNATTGNTTAAASQQQQNTSNTTTTATTTTNANDADGANLLLEVREDSTVDWAPKGDSLQWDSPNESSTFFGVQGTAGENTNTATTTTTQNKNEGGGLLHTPNQGFLVNQQQQVQGASQTSVESNENISSTVAPTASTTNVTGAAAFLGSNEQQQMFMQQRQQQQQQYQYQQQHKEQQQQPHHFQHDQHQQNDNSIKQRNKSQAQAMNEELLRQARLFPPPPAPVIHEQDEANSIARFELWYFHASNWDITHTTVPPPRNPRDFLIAGGEPSAMPMTPDYWMYRCVHWSDHCNKKFAYPTSDNALRPSMALYSSDEVLESVAAH